MIDDVSAITLNSLDLQQLRAESACRELVLAAGEAIDGRDYNAFAALFASDGELVRPDGKVLRGAQAIVAAYGQRNPDRLTRHLFCNQCVQVDLQGKTAKVASTIMLWTGRYSDAVTPRGRPADPVQQVGEIRDQLVLTSGGWRIGRRDAWFTLFRESGPA